jgi:lipopolysaccharide transport system ATP-binding protein
MSDVVIRVENLSKQYRLGQVGTGSLKDDFKRWRYQLMGKEDPFLTVGEENDRTSKSNADYVWALKNINFEVKRGDVLGIIGKNGAGKSTLLKILSRTTGPTTGSLKMKGRVASLLEVGTGFHGELSGRENIYLNGAIMGMRKAEITKKLDEIIDFAGVDRYVDTPVKRYSSGMYVRLAFGVAAHLEPDILIVDEVLAVGDKEFQKKALGKMKDVSTEDGRTVLFVSHNMAAVKNLCEKSLYLKNGLLDFMDNTDHTLQYYLKDIQVKTKTTLYNIRDRKGNGIIRFADIRAFNSIGEETNTFFCGESLCFQISFENKENLMLVKANVDIGINNQYDDRVAWLSSSMFVDTFDFSNGKLAFNIKRLSLVPGNYNINIFCKVEDSIADWVENVFSFDIIESDFYLTGRKIPAGQGYIFLDYETNYQ